MFSSDGRFVFCQREEVWDGMPAIRQTDAGWMFFIGDEAANTRQPGPERSLPAQTRAPLPRAVLDHVYRTLADLCGLDEHGREDVLVRRCFPTALETGIYFSLPKSGKAKVAVSEALIAQFGLDTITRTPGFLVTCRKCDGRGTSGTSGCRQCDGLGQSRPRFFSVRGERHDYAAIGIDEKGLAFWGTVRRLPFAADHDSNKYFLLSSSRGQDASLSGLPKYHVAGRGYPLHQVWFTEGVIKAEVAASHLRRRVIGVYSTSVDSATLAEIKRLAREWREQCS